MASGKGINEGAFPLLLSALSKWYDKHRYVSMLKVLYRDLLQNAGLLKSATSTSELMDMLIVSGHLHHANLKVLYDTIKATDTFGLEKEIKPRILLFPNVRTEIILKFTKHRQKIMMFGMALTDDDIGKISRLYNEPVKKYENAWSLIMDLESRMIIHKKKMTAFIDILKNNNLVQAEKALTEDISIASSYTVEEPVRGIDDHVFKSQLLPAFSEWYDQIGYVSMLKVLYRDLIKHTLRLTEASETKDLMDLLSASGNLHSTDIKVLCDTIKATDTFGLENEIKMQIPSCPNLRSVSISKFTHYRQTVMRLGMALEDDNIRKIQRLYKKKLVKNYPDVWSLIMDLEHQMIICEGRMKDFIDRLNQLELLQAVNALTEDISNASSNSGSLEDVSDLCLNSVQECVKDVSNVSPNAVEEFVEGIETHVRKRIRRSSDSEGIETHVRKRIRRSSDSECTGKKHVCKRKIISSDCEGIVENLRRHSDSADIALRLIHSVNLQCTENYEFRLVKLLKKPRDSMNSADKEQLFEIIMNLKNLCSSLGLDLNKLINNCIVFCLSAYDSIGLLNLWKMHISRKLIEDLADILVPQEHQQQFLDEWTTYIDENEYKGALMKLMEKEKKCLETGSTFQTLEGTFTVKLSRHLDVEHGVGSDMTLPTQIKARGKDEIEFVNEIDMTLVNSRVRFLGKIGAGKTSLVNSILGKQCQENEPSTDGIVITKAFQTAGEVCSEWDEHKDVDETSDVSQYGANVLTRQFARILKKRKKKKKKKKKKKIVAKIDRHNPKPKLIHALLKPIIRKIMRKKTTVKVMSDALSECDEENVLSDVTCIWDYAGQISYYITDRFFLTGGKSYVVVFSLFDLLNELAKSRGPLKDQFEMINLQMIIFWIRSIYEYAVLQYNASRTLINDTIASPTISLVGTHKDKLEGSEEDKQNQIEAIFKIIFEEIKGMPFELHVDRTMYAVDNTSANDKGIEELKKNLGGYTKQMAKTVPTKWVDFQSKIQEVGKTTLRMSVDEVNEIAVDCGIPNENTIHILNYLNDCGIIMYSPTNIKLKNIVITKVHMLIEIFTKVITTEDQRPAMMKLWHLLDKGILSETLLRHLWKHELEEDASSFDIFVELMKVFGLLFEKQTESEEDDRTFIVPCLMSIVKDKNMEVEKDNKNMVSIYVTPTDFLPDAVYSVLVVAFVDLMKEKGRSDDAKLFQNRSDFDFDDNHLVSLGAVKIKNMHALKLEITHRIVVESNDKQVISEPHPIVCMEVLNYLKHQLKTVYGTTEGIGYKLRVLCSVCQPTQQPHLHDLEDCLKKDKVSCGDLSMKTFRFKRLFSTDIPDKSLSMDPPHSPVFTDSTHREQMSDVQDKSLSTDQVRRPVLTDSTHGERMPEMSGMQFNAFKMVVSNWFDENRCLSMLKVLFRDMVDNVKLAEINNTIDLLNEVAVHGKMSAEDPSLLYDTIRITGHFALQKRIQETLPSFPDVKEGTISTSFTPHRQKLMKLGKTLTTDNVAQIDGLYNTPRKMYTDSWSMITNLEDRRKISEGNMTDFINSLSLLKLPLALAALTEELEVE